MQQLSNHDLLIQAQKAAQQENWSLLNQYLREFWGQSVAQHIPVMGEATRASGDERSSDVPSQQVLALAIAALKSGDFQDRWDIAKLLSDWGTGSWIEPTPLVLTLVAIVDDEQADLELRWFAIRLLGDFPQEEAIAPLIALLQTTDSEELSSAAAMALAGFGTAAIARLEPLLEDARTQHSVVRALAQIRQSATIPLLLKVVKTDPVPVRAIALEALSSFRDPKIVPCLVEALHDSSSDIRCIAVTGLGFRVDLLNSLDLVALLQPLLYDLNPKVCRQTTIALGRLGTDAAAVSLFESLQAPHAPVATQIDLIRALGWMQTDTALTYLEQFFAQVQQRSSPPALYRELITTLGQLEPADLKQRAIYCLIDFLQSQHPVLSDVQVRQLLAFELGKSGQLITLDPLVQLLSDADESVRFHAIAALKKLDASVTYQTLHQLAENQNLSPELQQGVAIALQEWHLFL